MESKDARGALSPLVRAAETERWRGLRRGWRPQQDAASGPPGVAAGRHGGSQGPQYRVRRVELPRVVWGDGLQARGFGHEDFHGPKLDRKMLSPLQQY